jgi:hypothetical protein
MADSLVYINGIQHQVQNADIDAFPIPTRPASVVTVLIPDTAVVGGADVTMRVRGENFTHATKVLWNGAEEPTAYVSKSEITTVVKPSTASGPGVVPVGAVGASGTADFTFTAAE